MTIGREDLMAAASAGLLQYRQIDPLLVFLLQRDVRARRLALAAQARPIHQKMHVALSWVLTLLALVTGVLFALLFATRTVQAMNTGALLAFMVPYVLAGFALVFWFRQRGYCRRLRLLVAFVIASVPLAVFALQQAAN